MFLPHGTKEEKRRSETNAKAWFCPVIHVGLPCDSCDPPVEVVLFFLLACQQEKLLKLFCTAGCLELTMLKDLEG